MPFDPTRLIALRTTKGWDRQSAFAERAQIAQSHLSAIERGRAPSLDVLLRIAAALDCTTDYLLGVGPAYANAEVAAAQMSLDVYNRDPRCTGDHRARCVRVIDHDAAPRTAEAWRVLMEQIDLAIGSGGNVPARLVKGSAI